MSNSVYASLSRQSGLLKEMQVVANNIANSSTTGFKSEGVIFAEHIKALGPQDQSLSMATADAHRTNLAQAGLTQTGGRFDLAIEGEGFFQVETPAGPRLTRAGAFIPSPAGELLTPEGYPLLDAGGAPVFVPVDAISVAVASDGTLSADGTPLGQIGVVLPNDPNDLIREDGVRFRVDGAVDVAPDAALVQGFLEGSNVDPVGQIARMIEVQRNYEMGQAFLEREDERLRSVMTLISR
jgi:flagellar basal-body rod protein FlgF